MPEKYFPINTATSCRLKWSWSTLYLNTGMTGSCHRSSFSILDNDFVDFHNTDPKIQARKKMLEGKWPGDGCEYCMNIENLGGSSDRQFQNQIPELYPPELNDDSTKVIIDPVILEVFFSNTCNLKCVYCSAKFSSAIQQENEKFGGSIIPIDDHRYADNRYKDLEPRFWAWMKNKGQSLKRLQILGGEPFLQHDTDKLIDYFDNNPHPDLEFNIVTNLMIPTKILDKKIERLSKILDEKKLNRVDLLFSIDSWGPCQEYTRFGFDRCIFEHNLNRIQSVGKFRLGLLTTVNSLSINEMPELCDKFLQWNKKSTLYWYMHLVLPEGKSIFNPMIFDYTNFSESLEKISKILPKTTWDDQRTFEVFDGIKHKLESGCKDQKDQQVKLFDYLDKIDLRRNLNWKKTFTWLGQDT